MYNFITENIKKAILSNGLTVYYFNNPEFEELYANYTLNYGSNDLEYFFGEEKFCDPMGIAHYLEHLMFANGELDYFDDFIKLGASSNAYTSFTQTSYLFTATSNYQENLQILLEMVQTLNVSEKQIEEEFGIIKEEIEMYNNKPNYQLQDLLFANSCNTNYRNNIAGTVDSISQITKEHIFRLFNQFYQPSNATLFVAGNIEFELIEFLENNQIIKNKVDKPIHYRKKEQANVDYREYSFKNKQVEDTQTMFGIKLPTITNDYEMIIDDIVFELILNWITSDINPNYQLAIANQQINESLSGYYLIDKEISMLVFKIRSGNQQEVLQYIKDELKSITPTYLEALRKKKIGSEIRLFSIPRNIVEYSLDLILREIDFNFYFETLYNIDVELLHEHLIRRVNKLEIICQSMTKEERG